MRAYQRLEFCLLLVLKVSLLFIKIVFIVVSLDCGLEIGFLHLCAGGQLWLYLLLLSKFSLFLSEFSLFSLQGKVALAILLFLLSAPQHSNRTSFR